MPARSQAPLQALHLPAPSSSQLTLYRGALDFDRELRHAMSAAVNRCGDSRAVIAARMSDLADTRVTEAMLDAWTAPSRTKWNIPVKLAAAFDVVTASTCVLEVIARKENHAVLSAREALHAELGRLQRAEGDIRERRAQILAELSIEDHL